MNTFDDSSDRRYFEAERHAALTIKDEQHWLKWETQIQFHAIRAHLIHFLARFHARKR